MFQTFAGHKLFFVSQISSAISVKYYADNLVYVEARSKNWRVIIIS